MTRSRVCCGALALLSLIVAGCSADSATTHETATTAQRAAPKGPPSELRAFTGGHTRVGWVQGDGTGRETEGVNLIRLGSDSDDGQGERVIVGQRRSIVEPRRTWRAAR